MSNCTDHNSPKPVLVEDATFYRPVAPHFILAALIGHKAAGPVPSVDEDEAGFLDKIVIVQDAFDAWLAHHGITDHSYAEHTEPAMERLCQRRSNFPSAGRSNSASVLNA